MIANINAVLDEVPITKQRRVPVDLDQFISKPHIPRANVAVDKEHPNGSPGHPSNRTVLQQHADFFDRNKDGFVTPWETYESLRALGFSLFWSIVAVIVIQAPLSFVTTKMFPFDPLLRIDISNIHRGKHGSDSGVFDSEGRFEVQHFETLFAAWDHDEKGGLTFDEIWQMTSDRWMMYDYFGWFAAKFEWLMLYILCVDPVTGIVPKEMIRGVYDGSLFYAIEKRKVAMVR